jgi:hypothetical protein
MHLHFQIVAHNNVAIGKYTGGRDRCQEQQFADAREPAGTLVFGN